MRILVLLTIASMCSAACSDPEHERIVKTTQPTYDNDTGRLVELTFDRNRNGTVDTWTEMDGSRMLRSRSDLDEDGTIDRWEYYDCLLYTSDAADERSSVDLG